MSTSSHRRDARAPRQASVDLLMLVVLAAVFVSPWTGVKVIGLPPTDLLLGVAGLLLLAAATTGRRRVPVRPWTLAPAIGAFVILALDVFLSRSALITSLGGSIAASGAFAGQGGGLLFFVRTLLATAVMFVLVEAEVRRFGTVGARRILEAFVLGTLVSVAAAVYSDRTGTSLIELYNVDVTLRAAGLAFHPNSLGQSVALAIPAVVCAAALHRRGFARFAIVAISLPLLAWGLLLADSRGALAVSGFVFALLALAYLSRWRRGRWIVPVGVVTVLAAWFLWPSFVAGTRLSGAGLLGINDADVGRSDYLAQAWELFSLSPLVGAGLGNGAGVMVPAYLVSSGGVVLAGGFAIFLVRALYETWRRTSPLPRAYGAIAIVCLILMGLPNNSVNERFDYVTLAVVVSLALNLGSMTVAVRRRATESQLHAPWRRHSDSAPPEVMARTHAGAIDAPRQA